MLASVLTVAIAMTWTISTAFWTGFACYALAAAAFWKVSKEPRPQAADAVGAGREQASLA